MIAGLEKQHADMRGLLEKLRTYTHLTFRSEEVPNLLSEFLKQVYQHFKSEREALLTVLENDHDRLAYNAHYLAVLEEIAEIQFCLILDQDMPVAQVLPRMEDWIASHEKLHSHLGLPIR